jgi:hypothetical protein
LLPHHHFFQARRDGPVPRRRFAPFVFLSRLAGGGVEDVLKDAHPAAVQLRSEFLPQAIKDTDLPFHFFGI